MTSPLPNPQPSPSSHLKGFAELDSRIVAAEHAVLVRDQRWRADARIFFERLRERSRYSARIAALAGVGAFGLGWLMARSAPRPRHGGRAGQPAQRLAEAPWAGLVPIVWPLLPQAVRSRVSPGLAAFITGIGLPLLAQRLSRRAARKAEQRAPPAAADSGVRHR